MRSALRLPRFILIGCLATGVANAQPDISASQLTLSPDLAHRVEELLSVLGYEVGTVDATWDEQSRQALIEFQRTQGLQPTGQLDDATRAALALAAKQGPQASKDDSAVERSQG